MKIINNIFIMILIALSGCQVSTLTDNTANEFIATASQGLSDHVEVEWIKADYYANFAVLRSSSEYGTYTPITRRINATKYVDQNIEAGATYYYKVQGYNDIGTAMYLTDSAKGYAGSGGGFLPPKNVKINSGQSSSSLKLEWDKVEDAVSYQILRSENNIDFDKNFAETSLSHYEDEDIQSGKIYYYKITSLNKDNLPSQNSSQVVKGSVFGADLGFSTEAGAHVDKIVLTWEKYEYATRYVLFRSEVKGDDLGDLIKTIGQSEATEYIDTDVEKSKLYYYTIIYQNDSGTLNQSVAIRGYLQTEGTPEKPVDFTVSQGLYPNDVELSWTAVDGAISYEIARSTSETGPWQTIKETTEITYKDKVPNESYTYFYTVTGLNPAPGTRSDIKEGWANKAPLNITASDNLGEKIVIAWDSVTNASSYIVSSSETSDGEYKPVGTVDASDLAKISFDHVFSIAGEFKELFYKVQVTTAGGSSLPSEPISGAIKKIGAPQNVIVESNKTATKNMIIVWDDVPGAKSYKIYEATLSHKNSDPNKLKVEHFKHIGNAENRTYNLSFDRAPYPIRRHVYMVKAVDAAGAEGVFTKTDLVWRMPVDLVDFARDVDFTIVQAQTQIPNFGDDGSGATITARASGSYVYKASLFGSVNIWKKYSSFEVIIDGEQDVEIVGIGATLNGPANISGLYTGTIIYNQLKAKPGGAVTGGTITVKYNHPTGPIEVTWPHNVAAGYLNSVVLYGSESSPGKPSYEAGNG